MTCKTLYSAVIPILWNCVPSLSTLIILFPQDLWEFKCVPLQSHPRDAQVLSDWEMDDEDLSSPESSFEKSSSEPDSAHTRKRASQLVSILDMYPTEEPDCSSLPVLCA